MKTVELKSSASLTVLCVLSLGASAANAQLDEIVVTSQLREQSLQDVPVAVSAFSAENLEEMNALDVTDLANFLPNVSYDVMTNAGYATPVIRGVGLTGATQSAFSNSPATAFYIDGVYFGPGAANMFSVVDVERVEVLRGPQGALYGRNALGGVINIISKKPDDEFNATLRASYGTFDRLEVGGSVSGPLGSEKLLGRVSISYIERDGFAENTFASPNPTFNEDNADLDFFENLSVRGSLVWAPADNLEVTLTGDYSKVETSVASYEPPPDAPGFDFSGVGFPGVAYTPDAELFKEAWNGANDTEAENYGASLTAEWSGANVRVVSITGYRYSDYLDVGADYDGSPFNIVHQPWLESDEESFSQELRFHYFTDVLESVFGLYYSKSDSRQDATTDIFGIEREAGYPFGFPGVAGFLERSVADLNDESLSAFAHAEYSVSPRFRIEAGLRFTSTEIDFFGPTQRVEFGDPVLNPFYNGENAWDDVPAGVILVGGPRIEPSVTFEKLTPRVGVQYDVNDDAMIYASWSRGFREGGFTARPAARSGSFDEETLDAYEIGLKSDLFNNVLRVNAAAYFYDYRDQQVEVSTFSGSGIFLDIFNSGKSRAKGVEVEFLFAPTENFTLQGSAGWQDTEFRELDTDGDLTTTADNQRGNQFPRAPKYTVNLIPTYIVDLPSNYGSLSIRGEYSYQSTEEGDIFNSPSLAFDSRNIFGASISYATPDEDWELTVWGRNILNEEYEARFQDLRPVLGYPLIGYGDPREVGVTLKYRFN